MDKNDHQGYYDSIWEEIEPHKRKGGNKKQKQTGIPVVIVIIEKCTRHCEHELKPFNDKGANWNRHGSVLDLLI